MSADGVLPPLHSTQVTPKRSRYLRNRAILEAALARPVNRFVYADQLPPLAELAAAYAYGITKAHAFIDGNKRTALIVALVFLSLNGQHFRRNRTRAAS